MQIFYICLLYLIVPILTNHICDNKYATCLENENSTNCECLKNYTLCLQWNPDCTDEDHDSLGTVCQYSGCSHVNCDETPEVTPPDCPFCTDQFIFCVNETFRNSSSLLNPTTRTCICLSSLTECLTSLSCPPIAVLDTYCGTFGSICAKDSNETENSTFTCGDKDYHFTSPTIEQIKEYIEDRLDELEHYWVNKIIGLINVIIENIRDEADGSISIDITFNYDNETTVDTVLEDIKNDLSNCTGVETERITTTVNSHSKRATLGSAGGTITVGVDGKHSGAAQLYSSLVFLAGSILMLRLLSQ